MAFKPVWNPLEGKFDYVLAPFSTIFITIAGSTSIVVDAEPMASFQSGDYYFRIKRVSDGKVRSFHLTVNNDNGVIQDSLYGRVGGALSVGVDTDVNGSDYELTIVNNNVGNLEVSYIKTTI